MSSTHNEPPRAPVYSYHCTQEVFSEKTFPKVIQDQVSSQLRCKYSNASHKIGKAIKACLSPIRCFNLYTNKSTQDIKNALKTEANKPPPKCAFITHDVSKKFSVKNVTKRDANKDQAEYFVSTELKLKTSQIIGTKAIKINTGKELGGHETKNNNAVNRQARICFTNLIF